MTWNRGAAVVWLVAGLSTAIVAQEPTPTPPPEPPPAPEPAPTAPAVEPEADKESFFGDRFALYLEVRAGAASAEPIETDITSNQNLATQSELEFDELKNGEFTIGWTLPRDRGQYLFTFTGIADDSYTLDTTGLQRAYFDPSGGTPVLLPNLLPWWHMTIRDGQLRSTETPPVWDSIVDDVDLDAIPDADEISFPETTIDVSRGVPDDLGSTLQTYDLYYRRSFGGTRFHARWTAGVRYLDYHGAFPMPLWINLGATVPGSGFSEGVLNPIIIAEHDSTGWGPLGSAEVQFNFFRRRLQLYLLVRAAFLVSSSEVDSGTFEFLAPDVAGSGTVPRQGRFESTVDKSTWNNAFEAGVRFRIAPGFHVFADWNQSGYLDPIIVPTTVSLPQNSSQIDQPIGVTFKTEDIVLSTIQLGLSFQF